MILTYDAIYRLSVESLEGTLIQIQHDEISVLIAFEKPIYLCLEAHTPNYTPAWAHQYM